MDQKSTDDYEFWEKAMGGQEILVRPIKPEDEPLLKELFGVLSKNSIYNRFFSTIKELSPAMLDRFTQIDYDRQIALVALDRHSNKNEMLGVARVIGDPDGKTKTGEFSVLVGDPWHGQGIGALLLTRVLQLAKQRGIEKVWGIVLRENQNMRALGEKLGFVEKAGEDAQEIKLKIDLEAADLSFIDTKQVQH